MPCVAAITSFRAMIKLVLFDIDGTLIVTGGTGRRSVNRAFGKLHARPDACDTFGFDGMTDRLIARRAFRTPDRLSTDEKLTPRLPLCQDCRVRAA